MAKDAKESPKKAKEEPEKAKEEPKKEAPLAAKKTAKGAPPAVKKPAKGSDNFPLTRAAVAVCFVLTGLRVSLRVPSHPQPPNVVVEPRSPHWEEKLRWSLATHGYAHVPSLLSRTEVEGLRKLAQDYCYGEKRKALPLSYGGYSVPGFLDIPEFKDARWLSEDERLHDVLRATFNGTDYRFASHNDVGCDFVGVWHKDVLRGTASQYQECDVWSPDHEGKVHDIYKVMFYLQDHVHDEQAMKVIPGSHVERRTPWERGYVALHPTMGDAVIFDQRLSHAGNTHYDALGQGRLFMQVGFGRKNQFTDQFEKGTIERQETLKARMLKAQPVERGPWTRLADLKFTLLGAALSAAPPQILNYFADRIVEEHEKRSCSDGMWSGSRSSPHYTGGEL